MKTTFGDTPSVCCGEIHYFWTCLEILILAFVILLGELSTRGRISPLAEKLGELGNFNMLTKDFDYNLPAELIAQTPVTPRDDSKLMVLDKQKQTIEHRHFFDIINYLQAGDLLVWNNSKVFKARLFGELESNENQELLDHKKKIEIFLVREMENEGVWKVLAKPGKHVREGARIRFAKDFYCDAMIKEKEGTILVQFPPSAGSGQADNAAEVMKKANKYGHIPVPPYVKDEPHELESYQTVYAKSEGSVAAPTAGFHFTPELINQLKDKGVEFAEVTLHVGLGTFLPVKTDNLEEHTMHSEWVELSQENADKINKAKKAGRRVIAVGTTTVRTLEGIAGKFQSADCKLQNDNSKTGGEIIKDKRYEIEDNFVHPYHGDINIFIKPGFKFKVIDAMITNFHLPKSTLLVLVSAFVGDREWTLDCYKKAVEEKYRFYSFGDAMFIM